MLLTVNFLENKLKTPVLQRNQRLTRDDIVFDYRRLEKFSGTSCLPNSKPTYLSFEKNMHE